MSQGYLCMIHLHKSNLEAKGEKRHLTRKMLATHLLLHKENTFAKDLT